MISLVGYTGFVGSNIYAGGGIDGAYNTGNIEDAYGTRPEVLIYAGLRAEKYLANNDPAADMELIVQAQENIEKIAPEKLVLISTIDVFGHPVGVDEDAAIDCGGLAAYGLNRYRLEQWVRERYPEALIIRLPGLYGKNIRKNFLYDYIHVVPSMLKKEKFEELLLGDADLEKYYELQPNGFYRCRPVTGGEKETLKAKFKKLGFTALHFTDSRSVYQFYPLGRLREDIGTAIDHGLKLWHPATEPVSAGEVYEYLTGEAFVNEITGRPAYYDYRTKYAELFGGQDGYLMNRRQVLEDIRTFVENTEHEE